MASCSSYTVVELFVIAEKANRSSGREMLLPLVDDKI